MAKAKSKSPTALAANDAKQLAQDSQKYKQAADKAGQMRNEIAKSLEQFRDVKFTDEDLHSFAKEAVQKVAITIQDVLDFIDNLAEMKHISPKQKAAFLKEFHDGAAKNQILRELTNKSTVKF